jgi:hypothetical protein
MFTTNTETITSHAEKTTFSCSSCAFSSKSKEAMLSHFGQMHAVSARSSCGDDLAFCLLESEEAFNAWVAYERRSDRMSSSSSWRGPGWYTLERWSSPCGRGCCSDDWVAARFAPQVLEERLETIREQARTLVEIRALLREGV